MANPISLQALQLKDEHSFLLSKLIKSMVTLSQYKSHAHHLNKLHAMLLLLNIDTDTFQMAFNKEYKRKLRIHILFIRFLNQSVDFLLEKEALIEFAKNLEETQRILKYKELDDKEREQRHLAFAGLYELIFDDKDFVIYAMLYMRVEIANITIESLKTYRSELIFKIAQVEKELHSNLKSELRNSSLFKHLNDKEVDDITAGVKKICDDIDARFSNAATGAQLLNTNPQRQALSFGSIPISATEQEKTKALKKNKKVLKFLKKHHEGKQPKEKSTTTLQDLPKLDKLTKQAIKYHEEYVAQKQEIEAQIKIVDSRIEIEEAKKQNCLQQLEKISEPRKRDRFKKSIERSFSHLEQRNTMKRESLEKKMKEASICDDAITALHPEVLGQKKTLPPTTQSHKKAYTMPLKESKKDAPKFKAQTQTKEPTNIGKGIESKNPKDSKSNG